MALSHMKVWEFHPGMFFKKYRCPQCGAKPIREKYTRTVTKEDDDFYEYYRSGKPRRMHYIGLEEIHVVTSRYVCPVCNKAYSYEQLRDSAKAAKKNKK